MTISVKWGRVSLYFLVIAMILGVVLRLNYFYSPIRFNFRYLVHGHSHVVLLGWVFNAICALIIHLYEVNVSRKVKTLFYIFQISIIGMLISFPIQGYGLVSISFSTLHIICSYVFLVHFLIKTWHIQSFSIQYIRWAIVYLLISTIGPFSLGPIVVNGLSDTPIYDLAIYYYLHFMCNGFFVLAVIGIFTKIVENKKWKFDEGKMRKALWLMAISVIPTFVMSALGFYPTNSNYFISGLGGLMQILGFIFLFQSIASKQALPFIKKHGLSFGVSILALMLKLFLQLLSAVPILNTLIYESHNLIISYLHLVFIGFTTLALIGFFNVFGFLRFSNNTPKMGYFILLAGFIGSELLIMFPDLISILNLAIIPMYFQWLFFFSVLMLVGVVMIVSDQLPGREESIPVE